MSNSLLTGIPGVLVPVRDLQKSADWYENVLGLEVFKKSDETVEFKVSDGDPVLILVESNFESSVRFPNNPFTDGSFFIFKTSDADSLHKMLVDHNVKVSEIFLFEDVQKYFFFEDLDGNKLSVEN